MYRWAAATYAGLFVLLGLDDYRRPGLAVGVLVAVVAWSAVTTALYARRRPGWPLLVADLGTSTLLLLATLAVETRARIDEGVPTLTVSWVAAAVLAWAVRGGPVAGLTAAAVLAAANVAIKEGRVGATTLNSVVLLVLLGLVVGLVARLALRAEAQLAEAVRREAATAERDRLARGIHDGVLQVLALVQRRGAELGGPAAELGRLAGEQEASLRALVGTSAPPPGAARTPAAGPPGPLGGPPGPPGRPHATPPGGDDAPLDLVGLLGGRGASGRVTVSAPAGPVPLPAAVAREVAAAALAALDNAALHAGDEARAFVLVEDEGDAVVVTVRDDGVGMPAGRLAEAAAAGRLGVAQSIVGRLRDLGGSASLTSAPGLGTEVELRVPRPEPRRDR